MKNTRIQCLTHQKEQLQEINTINIVILYVLKNNLQIITNSRLVTLKQNDIILINQNSDYQCKKNDSLFVSYKIYSNELKNVLNNKRYTFICDSTKEWNSNYDKIRKILSEILVVLYNRPTYMSVKLNQLYYDLIFILLNDFSVEQTSDNFSDKEVLMQYIDYHYQEDLSLEKISEDFHMSSQYFSKYFKKHIGIPYLKYLTDIRLQYALNDVICTNKKFLSIAMDYGFANVGSFNHYFKEKYNLSPKEYRESHKNIQSDSSDSFLSNAIESLSIKPEIHANESSLIVNSEQKFEYAPFWNKLLHFGDSVLLDSSQVLNQLKELQSSLKFEYIRIYLDCQSFIKKSNYNFVREQVRFTELYKMGFKLWISFEYRDIKDIDGLCSYLKAFLSFIVGQWSIIEIQKWIFEITYNSTFSNGKLKNYLNCVYRIQDVLKQFGCEKQIVTAGLALGNLEGIDHFYKYVDKNHLSFENQSFVVEPYAYYHDEDGNEIARPSQNDVHRQLLMINERYPYFQTTVKNIFITSWRNNLQQLNLMNDSCYQGALIIKNFLSCFGQINSITQCIALDSMYETHLQKGILFGGNGLMSHNGIKKPSYYAYEFMRNIGNSYLGRNDHILLFANDYGNYHVIAHNCKELSYRYFMEENNLDVNHLNDYFEDLNPLKIHIHINNVKNGSYKIKRSSISKRGGSVQDEYKKMVNGTSTFLHQHDIDFLKNICIPHLQLNEIHVTNNELIVDFVLDANEFVFIHIIQEY